MRTERNLIPVIDAISRQAKSVDEAIELFQSLLAGEVGGAKLLVDTVHEGMSPDSGQTIATFMESREFPFRGLYTAPLTVGTRNVGRLMACFGSFGGPGKSLPQITAHIARRLSGILESTSRAILARPLTQIVSYPEVA
jgi:hypothetical protein